MTSFPGVPVGVLGAGQLARMLAASAHNMGLNIHIFSDKPNQPATQVCDKVTIDTTDHIGALQRFMDSVDHCTFESEFIDIDHLLRLPATSQAKFFPHPEIMRKIQDRDSQKDLLNKFKIRTSESKKITNIYDFSDAMKELGNEVVVKKRRNGYDGYGTYYVRNKEEYAKFKEVLVSTNERFIVEKFVEFKRELALTAIRNKAGDVVFLPLVETRQKNSKCFWVKGPIKHKALDNMKSRIRNMMNILDYQGVLTFELFDCGKELLVNELAPRVHNSAHYTLDALTLSQFDLHWMAGMNLPIREPKMLAKGFAMVNLIGESDRIPSWQMPKSSRLYWYGKEQNRHGRKMGHLNALGKKPDEALKVGLADLKGFQL